MAKYDEAAFRKFFCEQLKARGIPFRRMEPAVGASPGLPDLMIFDPVRVYFVELKIVRKWLAPDLAFLKHPLSSEQLHFAELCRRFSDVPYLIIVGDWSDGEWKTFYAERIDPTRSIVSLFLQKDPFRLGPSLDILPLDTIGKRMKSSALAE